MPELPPEELEEVALEIGPQWEELREGAVFLTGGTGFIGPWLVESFLRANSRFHLKASLVVLTRDPERFWRQAPHLSHRPEVRFHRGDIRSFEFPPGSFSHIIHGAAPAAAPAAGEDPIELVETIVGGTRRVLDFASCAGVRKVLLLSSGAVYGTQPPDMAAIPEDYPGAPQPRDRRFAYGEGKRVAESLCCAAADRTGWEAKVARCFTFAGPRLPLDGPFAIGNFVRDALARRPIRVRGDGSAIRSYLYASDLAAWLWTILFRGCPDRAYNVGSDWAISIADLARTVAAILPGGVPVEIVAPGGGQTPLQRYVPDIGRAAAELGLRVRVPLEEAIRRMAAWYERCPGYCSAIGAVP